MTLIELLAAIAVLGIFMGIALPSVIKSVHLTSQVRHVTERYPNSRKALNRMADTIRSAYPGAVESDILFVGASSSLEAGGIMIPSDELSFPILDTSYAHFRSVQRISYRVDLSSVEGEPLRGLVEHRSFAGAAPGTGMEETVLDRIVGLDFRYLDDSVSPQVWAQQWPPEAEGEAAGEAERKIARFPAAVKVTIFVLGDISPRPTSFTTIVNIPSKR
jgi:prepilin-type N-terminal cleavage/methylation domain-containing protein